MTMSRSIWIAALGLSVGVGCGSSKPGGSSGSTTGRTTTTTTTSTTSSSSGSHGASSGSSGSHGASSGSSGSSGSLGSTGTSGSSASGSTGGSSGSASGSGGSTGTTGSVLPAPTVNPLPPYTNQTSIAVSGTASPGATVTISGGLATATATASSAGAYSANVSLNLNALNTLSVVQSLGGATSPAATASTTEDNVAPSSAFTQPASGSSTNQSPIAVRGVCADNLSGVATVDVLVNGADAGPATVSSADGGCNFDYAFAAPANNNPTGVAYTFQSVATDRATNVETPAAGITVTYDTTPPAAPTLTGSTPASPVNTTAVTVNATVPCDAASITVTNVNTGATTTQAIPAAPGCSGTQTIGVAGVALQAVSGADTSNSLTATVSDAAGNASAASAPITVVQDSVTPTLSSVTVDGQAEQDVPQPPQPPQAAFQQVPAAPVTVVFNFNEPMDPATFSATSNFSLTDNAGGAPLTANCAFSASGTSVTCTTSASLAPDHVYTLKLTNTGFADTSNPSGGRTLDRSYSYQVYAVQTVVPAVASTAPANLARDVAVTNNSITVTFNEQVQSAPPQPDGGGATDSASNPASYTLEDCYLANTSTTPEPGCSTIAVSDVAYNAANDTATLTPATSLAGYYHTYKVTVAQTIANLGGTPMAAPYVFLYTNVNRLPGSGLQIVDNGQADGGVVFTADGGGAVNQVDSTLLAGAEDPDHNPVAFWYDCDNQLLTMSVWDGDARFINLRMSDKLGACNLGPSTSSPTGALPPIRKIEVGASPGGNVAAALFDFYLGWARYQLINIGLNAYAERDTVEALRVYRPVRWQYAPGGLQTVEPTVNQNPTRVSLAMDRTKTPPLPVLAVANNAGIHANPCSAEACVQQGPGGTNDWTAGAVFDATAQAKKTDSLSANIDSSESLWVSYTSNAVATGNLFLVITPLGATGTTLASSAMESLGTTDANVTSKLYGVTGSTTLQIGAAYHDNTNALIRDVAGPSTALPLTPHAISNPSNPAIAPRLDVFPDVTQVPGALQVGVVALRRGTNFSTVAIGTTTDFTSWTVTDVDPTAAPISGKGGATKADPGLVVFQGGTNAGKWGLFYLGQDQTQFIGQLYYRQQ